MEQAAKASDLQKLGVKALKWVATKWPAVVSGIKENIEKVSDAIGGIEAAAKDFSRYTKSKMSKAIASVLKGSNFIVSAVAFALADNKARAALGIAAAVAVGIIAAPFTESAILVFALATGASSGMKYLYNRFPAVKKFTDTVYTEVANGANSLFKFGTGVLRNNSVLRYFLPREDSSKSADSPLTVDSDTFLKVNRNQLKKVNNYWINNYWTNNYLGLKVPFGGVGTGKRSFYDSMLDTISGRLISDTTKVVIKPSAKGVKFPIGAFYESKSPASSSNDPAISDKTFVVLDTYGNGLTRNQLSSMDVNKDGKVSGNELNSVKVWIDANENGIAEAGEIRSFARTHLPSIAKEDYGFYTQGNSKRTFMASTAPTNTMRRNTVKAIPSSNYRSLRDKDNIYWVSGSQYITWKPNQIKIHYDNKEYLIGTDGDDFITMNTYKKYDGIYFHLNLINKFLGGPGNDSIVGSSRNDSIWGDSGNDKLFGGAGNDKLYGGDGNDAIAGFNPANIGSQTLSSGETDDDEIYGGGGDDTLQGGFGNDKIYGGSGNDEVTGNSGDDVLVGDSGDDVLVGGVGDDVVYGGAGNDIILGFTASNEAKQTLSYGETDNDILDGGSGNDRILGGFGDDILFGGLGDDNIKGGSGDDRLFGGSGSDNVQGGSGNDIVVGGTDDDKLFGQVGDDRLYGGAGDDIIVGFTGSDEAKQTLSYWETDNDEIYGGSGNDLISSGPGNDVIYGGSGKDEVVGGAGSDFIYGEAGNDKLFGGVGDDVVYGGAGDDTIVGFTPYNSKKQTLSSGETDNDKLYGGSGNDLILGGFGDDYIDGGAGNDRMQGGAGDDTYIVNSVNDVIFEKANNGIDTVISSSNYMLNKNIENLRLLEGFTINGTGNSLDNTIIGNSSDNTLDGVTGADTMIGRQGDDSYYVDNVGDKTIELSGEGNDTVLSKVSHTLSANVENLVLLDFAHGEKGLVDGREVIVFGYPKRNELDYMQGDAVDRFKGTCALTAISNVLIQSGANVTEKDVVTRAIKKKWATVDNIYSDYLLGGSNKEQQKKLLSSYSMSNDSIDGYNETGIANLVRSGRGVIVAVNAGRLWGNNKYIEDGGINHAITLTGVVYNKAGSIEGFYIADSGRGRIDDMTRFVSLVDFRKAANVAGSYSIYTKEAIKLWEERINGNGNSLDNTITGNRADNVLSGFGGDDILNGGAGNDTLNGGVGDDTLNGGTG